MDKSGNLAKLDSQRKAYKILSIVFGILFVLSIAAIIALLFILEEWYLSIIIACCVVPIIFLILSLLFCKLASNYVIKIVVAKFVVADFEPTKLFILNKFHKRYLYINTNKQEWAYSNKTEISKIHTFDEIEDCQVTLDEDLDYCFNFYFEIIYRNYDDPTKLVFFDHKINKDKQKYRNAVYTMNEIYKLMEKIKAHNQFNFEPKDEIIHDHELNVLRTELEKQKIRTELTNMQEKVCKYCGHKNKGNDEKCSNCGAPLDEIQTNNN